MQYLTVPFTLSLPARQGAVELACERVVRRLPDKRLVCTGTWQGRNVYIKLFHGAHKSRRDWQREINGIQHLEKAGIPTPRLLYSAHLTEHDNYLLVLEAIEPALTLNQAWDQAKTIDERLLLLKSMARTLASHHNAGIIHHDPHLKNFLVTERSILTLDGADIKRKGGSISTHAALTNLAAFFSVLHLRAGEYSKVFFDEYTGNRTNSSGPGDYHAFLNNVGKIRKHNMRKYLHEKIFRECTDFSRQRTMTRLYLTSRVYVNPYEQALFANPEALIAQTGNQILKKGNTSTVVKTRADHRDIVIKQYRIKGILHGFRKAFVRSRAESSWMNAHLMKAIGIKTAVPLAIMIHTAGPIRRDAYFITEHVAGQLLSDYLRTVDRDHKTEIAGKLAGLIHQLAANRIGHGDMKATNILVADDEPVLLDLDSMKQYSSEMLFRRQFRRDLARFMRNWPAGSDTYTMIREHIEPVTHEFS